MAFSDISINGKFPPEIYFNTPKYRVNKEFEYAYSSLKEAEIYNAKADTYHEFAHCYQASLNRKHYLSLTNEKFDEETKNAIAKALNSYAAKNKAEFVAEYFTYKMLGKKIYSDKIDLAKLYADCQGPQSKKLNFSV